MEEDLIVTGALAGVIGNIFKELFNYVSVALGWAKYSYWQVAASIFVKPENVNQFGAKILGTLGDFLLGASFGVLLLYLLNKTGRRYFEIKGLGLAWLLWMGLFGLVVNFEVVRLTPTDIGTSLSAFFSHSILGLGASLWLKNKSKKGVLPGC